MRSKDSARWLQEHFSDAYVKKAQQEGYRSRAVYKLAELQQSYSLFKSGMTIIDLGAAPGGWAQYLQKLLGKNGLIVAVDILPIPPIDGVNIIQGDFALPVVQDEISCYLDNKELSWLLSDMSPNLSGLKDVDQPRAMYLVELVLEYALIHQAHGILMKVFQGEGFDAFLRDVRKIFQQVLIRKPKASRGRSREVYIIGRGRKDI